MAVRRVATVVLVMIIGLGLVACDTNTAGSVTETGNVTGNVISKQSERPVAGAKIALFKKKLSISSPDETFAPESVIYSDSKGTFSVDLADGLYTITAAADSEYAFVDGIIPGTDDAKGMTVTLDKPGALQGEIVNSLELRGTGSIVVHLIGTALYQNTDKNGKFSIEDIPAGSYTLVSYSTYQPEFSPDYRQVTIHPDSTTVLTSYSLNYNGIPIPKNIRITYDTAAQTVAISWDAIDEYKDFQEYAVLRGVAGQAKHNLEQIGYTADTMYRDVIVFPEIAPVRYEYAIKVTNKLGEMGQYYGIYTIEAVPFALTLPRISAGSDRNVDIGTQVVLRGTVESSLWSVVKMEWKIGSGPWEQSNDGAAWFFTDSSLTSETTVCIFRVTDSKGQTAEDAVTVIKAPLIVTCGVLPGVTQGSGTINSAQPFLEFNGINWVCAPIVYGRNAVWSSTGCADWKLENSTPGLDNAGTLVRFNNTLFMLNLDSSWTTQKSYRSSDGAIWTEINIVRNNIAREGCSGYFVKDYCVANDKLFAVCVSTDSAGESRLICSDDGIIWNNRKNLSTANLFPMNLWDTKLFAQGGKIYLFSNQTLGCYTSTDGTTWEKSLLWDADYATFTDWIQAFSASDSVAAAFFKEQPGTVSKIALMRNGTWTTFPVMFDFSNIYWTWIVGNRFYWFDDYYDRTPKSIRLF